MIKYNLILLHIPDCVSDFVTIKNMMAGPAPDIDVHIIAEGNPVAPDFWSKAAERPSLIFSPTRHEVAPGLSGARGTILKNSKLGKLKEMEILSEVGIPVPRTVRIEPDTKLDEGEWGPLVVVKPDGRGAGLGVRLERTQDVRWFDPRIYPKNDPRRDSVMLAQQYINTGPYAESYRVFTVLGRTIYSIVSISTIEVPKPDPASKDVYKYKIASNRHERVIKHNYDEEILALAENVHQKLPHLPSLGIDIVREHETKRLFVLELNSSGGTWHLSSGHGRMHQRTYGLDYYGQFNALRRITDALIEATRKQAV